MKPRLRLKGHVWSCVARRSGWGSTPGFFCGYGYTPAEAYRDWANQCGIYPQMKEQAA